MSCFARSRCSQITNNYVITKTRQKFYIYRIKANENGTLRRLITSNFCTKIICQINLQQGSPLVASLGFFLRVTRFSSETFSTNILKAEIRKVRSLSDLLPSRPARVSAGTFTTSSFSAEEENTSAIQDFPFNL